MLRGGIHPLLESPYEPGRGARRKPRPPHGRRHAARARARGRARRVRPRRIRPDPRIPQGQGAPAGARSRTSARTGSGPRRSSPTSAAGSGTRPPGRGCVPIATPQYDFELPETEVEPWKLQRDRRGAADPRDRRLDDARGASCRRPSDPRGTRPGGSSTPCATRSPSSRRRTTGPAQGGRHRRRRPRRRRRRWASPTRSSSSARDGSCPRRARR